jgi:UDP-N-acetylmuramate dehydrogenase
MLTENVPLAGKTSYNIGGAARFYAEPRVEGEIADAYRHALERGLPVFILGNGSNILISDRGINALVINLSANFSTISWDGDRGVTVSGGFPLNDLTAEAAKRGLAGIEGLSGIPGTVGGAAVMNAGAFGTDVSKTLRRVCILKVPNLIIEEVPAEDLALGYRSSAIKGTSDVVLSAVFQFEPANADQVISSRKQILDRRREKQPLNYPSCGSVFKRPPESYAGTLIESCGLKGFKIGGAMVSEKHANFIINTGKAKAEDVRGVIRHVQKAVYEKTGILLEPEVIFVGEFDTPLYTPQS